MAGGGGMPDRRQSVAEARPCHANRTSQDIAVPDRSSAAEKHSAGRRLAETPTDRHTSAWRRPYDGHGAGCAAALARNNRDTSAAAVRENRPRGAWLPVSG